MPHKVSRRDVSDAVIGLLETGAKTVTVFSPPISTPRFRVRATRQHAEDRRSRSQTIVVSIGGLNYAEREYVKLCQRAGTKPRRLWLKYPKEHNNAQ